ncbi:tRNA(Ile)-lysidine synthase [Furfurilactobacillus curtus]|uniref:tRNA(Ile)-lysidine synthase n=1 Tax=Furfurilactobacillus curtus TaxID=1746200 RepID=A0ABQ5JNG5_9LACO
MQANRTHHLWQPEDTIVLAVSTGVDSMALLTLFRQLPKAQRPRLVVAHVNHQLRAQSDQEENYLRQYLASSDIKLVVKHWPQREHPKSGLEAAARQVRYNFFRTVMTQYQANVLATAHQQDEQVETALMAMIEGRSFTSNLAIEWRRPFANGHLIRPLLGVSKTMLRDFVRRQQIMSFEDTTNQELTATRNRVRQQLIPLIKQENPRFVADFSQSIVDQQQVTFYLRGQAQTILAEIGGQVTKVVQHELPTSFLLKQDFLRQQGPINIAAGAWQNAARGLTSGPPQTHFNLDKNWQLVRRYDNYFFQRRTQTPEKIELSLQFENKTMVTLNKRHPLSNGGWLDACDAQQVVTMQPQRHSVHVRVKASEWPLVVRLAKKTDLLTLHGGHHQQVRRILIDQKVPVEQRQAQLIVTTNTGRPLWLVGRKVAVGNDGALIELSIKLDGE